MHSRPLLLLPLLATGCGAQWGAPQATPEQIVGVLQPKLTFDLRDADYEAAAAATAAEDGDEPWRRQAQLVASLEQMDCASDVLGATSHMLDAAENSSDPLAMAALGTMYTFGQECSRKRNLTWGVHWLRRAASAGQADAQATLGFLHDTDLLRLLYNYTDLPFDKAKAVPLYEQAQTIKRRSVSVSSQMSHPHFCHMSEIKFTRQNKT